MFKRIMSVMLAVVLLMSVAVVAVSATETEGKVYVKVNDAVYEAERGQTFTYVYSLACDRKVCSLDCSTYYNAEGLKFLPKVDEYGDFTGEEYPNISTVYNHNMEGHILYNYSNVSGTRFPVADPLVEKNVVFSGEFEVTATSGVYEIYTDLKVLGDNNNVKIVFDSAMVDETATVIEQETVVGLTAGELPEDPSTEEPSTEAPSTEAPSTEAPSTEAPSTEAPSTDAPSTDAPAKKVQIRIDGDQVFDVVPGQVYTYTYSLACDRKICSLDCSTYYDADGLKFLPKVDEYGDFTGEEYPNISTVYNHNMAGHILYNYSNVAGTRFPVADPLTEKNIVFVGEFEVTAEEGIYDIWTDLKVLGDNNNNKIIFDSVVVDETAQVITNATLDGEIAPEDPSTEAPSTEAPSTEAPSTEAPSTEAPSTEAPSTEAPSTEAPSTEAPSSEEPSSDEPSTDEPTDVPDDPTLPEEGETTVPGAATQDQSSTDDNGNGGNGNAIQTGSTVAVFAFLAVILMAAGLVMFSRKRSNG